MKPLFPESKPVTTEKTVGAMCLVQRRLDLFGVKRANDLPEEAKVRMTRDLKAHFNGTIKVAPTFKERWKTFKWFIHHEKYRKSFSWRVAVNFRGILYLVRMWNFTGEKWFG